jgi:TonB family protein
MRLFITSMCLLILSAVSYAQDQPASPAGKQSSTDSVKTVRIGGNVMQASLVKQVTPVYPSDAKAAKISGTVVLHAVIGIDGKVADLTLISGHPLLATAAMDAVRQWEYKPTLLNGQPVRVDTTVSVVFTLGDNPTESSPTPAGSGEASANSDSSVKTVPLIHVQSVTTINPQLQTDLDQLLEVMHYQEKATAGMRAMIPTIRKQIEVAFPATPNHDKILDDFFDQLLALAKTDEFKTAMEKVYAKYLSDDDVKAMIEFYKTPAGEHYNQFGANIISECGQAGETIGQSHAIEIMKNLCKEYPELQGTADFCPANANQTGRLENRPNSSSGGI